MAASVSSVHIRFPLWSTKDCSSSRRRSPFLSLSPRTLDPKTLKSSHALTKTHLLLLPRKVGGFGTRNPRSVAVRCEASNDGRVSFYFFFSFPAFALRTIFCSFFFYFLEWVSIFFSWMHLGISMIWVRISIHFGRSMRQDSDESTRRLGRFKSVHFTIVCSNRTLNWQVIMDKSTVDITPVLVSFKLMSKW